MDPELSAGIPMALALTVLVAGAAAAETALERANDARIHALAAQGHPRARRIAGNVRQPAAFLGPLTAARVLASAMLVSVAAWLGADSSGPAGALWAGAAAGAWSALVQMTVGIVAARQPELAAIQLGEVVRAVNVIMWAPAWLLGLPGRLIARPLRALGGKGYNDLLAIVEREEAAGSIAGYEKRMIQGVVDLEEKTAREIMVPRPDMAVVDIEEGVDDVARIVTERGFSRIPVYRETIDDIAGIIYAKDLLRSVTNGGRQKRLSDLMRPAVFIPESKRLDDLLTEMQARRVHMAVVVDEYGGTAGLVTIEDLIEEIVGEIEDEYDVAGPRTEVISDDAVIVDGAVSTDVLREVFEYEVESEDFDTIGGFVMHHLGRLPAPGDVVTEDGLTLEVLSVRGRRVGRVRIERGGVGQETAQEPALSQPA